MGASFSMKTASVLALALLLSTLGVERHRGGERDGWAIVVSPQRRSVQRNCSTCNSYPGGQETTIGDANGNVTTFIDFNGYKTTYAYDLTRNLETSRTETIGFGVQRTVTTTWHPTFRLPTQIASPGRTVSFTYDGQGNRLTKTIVAGTDTSTWTYSYNTNGQALTAADPLGHVTRLSYDSAGNLTSIANPLGQVTSITSYDADGRPLVIVSPNGLTTALAYNFRGQVTSLAQGALTTTYAYDLAGQLTRKTRPDGSTLSFAYDAAHRLTGVTDALGNRIAYTLDAMGNRVSEVVYDSANVVKQTHTRSFDKLGRLEKDFGAQGQTTSFLYDNKDNLRFVGDAYSNGFYRYFDGLSRPTQVNDPSGYSNLTYDALDRVTSVSDHRNNVTSYAFNSLDKPVSIVSPDTGTTTKTYDAAGNVLTTTDARGKTTTYAYDALNRLVSATLADASVISYAYDEGPTANVGQLTSMTDSAGKTSWNYDANGHLLSQTQQIGTITLTTQHSYSSATGQRTATLAPSGVTILYAYDANGRPSGVGYKPNATAPPSSLATGVVYQPFGSAASWTAGNGASYARSFDLDGRISGIVMAGGISQTLGYDVVSRVTSIKETGLPDKNFQYDGAYRLVDYYQGTGTPDTRYSSDYNTNRTYYSRFDGSTTTTFNYNYPGTSNRLSGLTGSWAESFTYDAAGNIVAHSTPSAQYTFSYDAKNRLAASALGALSESYWVNGLGQRVAKRDTFNPSAATYFAYDDAGRILGEYDASGAAIQETVWLGDLPVATLRSAGAFYVAPDHLGAPHQITNTLGQTVWSWDHDPFGNGQPASAAGFAYNLRFPGQYFDAETGLHNNGFRDYDPKLGRYIESDPIGLAGGLNTYAYVGGNPVNRIDPTGTCWGPAAVWCFRAALTVGRYAPMAAEALYAFVTGAPNSPAAVAEAGAAKIAAEAKATTSAVGNACKAAGGGLSLRTAESWGNPATLPRHFADHGADFGATSAAGYASQASQFFERSQAEGLLTKIDPSGVIRAYDPTSNIFGAYNANGTTRTFFKPTSPTYFDRQPGVTPTIYGGL